MRKLRPVLKMNMPGNKEYGLSLLKRALIWILLSFQFSASRGQEDSSARLVGKFDHYVKQVLQEKIYVHTDKSVYLSGEIIWFKLYAVDAFFHLPLHVSSVAYIEILDQSNKPLLQAKLAIKNGDGEGSFYLPSSLKSGNYRLRSYTNWMKNFSPAYFFEKTITIINALHSTESDSRIYTPSYIIGLFPEGGNLVNSLQSKLGFKVSDQYGKGIECEGILLDERDDTLTRFRPLKFGMGNFSFTPETGHVYRARFRFPDGKEIDKTLPPAYNSGYVMRLEKRSNKQLGIVVEERVDFPQGSNQEVYLMIHTRESIKWAGRGLLNNGIVRFQVDEDKLGGGISQITLFDHNQLPLCERLYFTYPKESLAFNIKTEQTAYACRKRVNVGIHAGDKAGIPALADMSMAVYRLDSLQTTEGFNIENYLWLSSDLSGAVESPDYYFNKDTPRVEEAIDNLMLTQGWRRFSWEDILKDKKPVFDFVPEYNGHIITGTVSDRKTGGPGKHIEGYLSAPGTGTLFRVAASDQAGNIRFEIKNLFGTQELIVQTNPLTDSAYRIDIASPFSDKYSESPLPFFSMPGGSPASLLYSSINIQAQNLYHGAELQELIQEPVDTIAFYAEPDTRYMLDDYTRFTTLEEIIREYVSGVNISKNEGKFNLVITNQDGTQRMFGDPLLLIDGTPIFDVDKFINNYDPLKLSKLEVVKKKYFLGYKSFDGILNFTTYKGDLDGFELDPHALALDYAGLQLQRKFYSPDYETLPQYDTHSPDFRSLLYWVPELKTDNRGITETSFFTSDIPGNYVIVLEGLDQNGRTGTQVYYFQVQNH